ncbi:unnamed protein product [Cylindrotheca closterium]|uniref:Uncharacterized protein n=1 Tax=Cylindrotheca closterium TaxID=2856 RepID=A0AAD2CPM1_9STRA|nr:unnamed protein product [Cylindrotheca closterium]
MMNDTTITTADLLPLRKHATSLFFDIGGHFQDPIAISQKLRLLQRHSTYLATLDNVAFMIWPDGPISQVVQDLIETIVCCSNQGCSFVRLIFHEYDVSDRNHLAVVQAACHHRLFRMLAVYSIVNDPVNELTLNALKDAIILNQDLKAINLFLEVPGTSLDILGEGLRKTKSLETLSIGFGRQELNQHCPPPLGFLQGLKDNHTLQSLSLRSLPTEAWTKEMLQALLDNPTLETLSVTHSSWGISSVAALGSLLASSHCRIAALTLSDPRVASRQVLLDNLGDILKKSNQSIQSLGLRYFGLDDVAFSTLWTGLSALKQLVSLDVEDNEITSLHLLLKSRKVARRLKRLNIDDNPILELEASQKEMASGLFQFLKAHTQLQSLGHSFAKPQPKLQHLLDRNANGRILFCNHADDMVHSLSIWPRVLERTNNNLQEHPVRQASVVYDLIRGLSGSL